MAEDRLGVIRCISREDLKAKIDGRETFMLVETLSPEHFQHAHLPGAINLAPDRVAELAPSVLPDKQMEIVAYCANVNCHASENAAAELMELGYTNVRVYPGGKHDWVTAGFPIERGELAPTEQHIHQ